MNLTVLFQVMNLNVFVQTVNIQYVYIHLEDAFIIKKKLLEIPGNQTHDLGGARGVH